MIKPEYSIYGMEQRYYTPEAAIADAKALIWESPDMRGLVILCGSEHIADVHFKPEVKYHPRKGPMPA